MRRGPWRHEIGAKGVKATVVDVTGEAETWNVKVLMSGTENTTLSTGLDHRDTSPLTRSRPPLPLWPDSLP